MSYLIVDVTLTTEVTFAVVTAVVESPVVLLLLRIGNLIIYFLLAFFNFLLVLLCTSV
jgi:hypothetical protein